MQLVGYTIGSDSYAVLLEAVLNATYILHWWSQLVQNIVWGSSMQHSVGMHKTNKLEG